MPLSSKVVCVAKTKSLHFRNVESPSKAISASLPNLLALWGVSRSKEKHVKKIQKSGLFLVDGVMKLIEDAKALEAAGCFSLVLECVPELVGDILTKSVHIPTIGIGAGAHCSGQVLVLHDMLGLLDHPMKRKVKVETGNRI